MKCTQLPSTQFRERCGACLPSFSPPPPSPSSLSSSSSSSHPSTVPTSSFSCSSSASLTSACVAVCIVRHQSVQWVVRGQGGSNCDPPTSQSTALRRDTACNTATASTTEEAEKEDAMSNEETRIVHGKARSPQATLNRQ